MTRRGAGILAAALAAGAVAGAALARLAWGGGEALPLVIAATPTRCVIDLLAAPAALVPDAGSPADAVAPSAPYGRYLVAEVRDGAAVVGTAADPGAPAGGAVAVAARAGAVNAYPDPRDPAVCVVTAAAGGWSRQPDAVLRLRRR